MISKFRKFRVDRKRILPAQVEGIFRLSGAWVSGVQMCRSSNEPESLDIQDGARALAFGSDDYAYTIANGNARSIS
jgi:hypothetical protein